MQMLLHITTDTADNIQPTTSQFEEGEESTSALRTRILELQATVEEVKKHVHLYCISTSSMSHEIKYMVCHSASPNYRRSVFLFKLYVFLR